MFEHYEPWAEDIPADLVPAMRHLREEFGDAHLKFGFTTRLLCHARLHKNEVDQYRDETEKACTVAGVGQFVCVDCGSPVQTGVPCQKCLGRRTKYTGLIFHDLRRTAARNLRRAGISETVIMKIGGWRTRSVFERYAIVSRGDIVDAMRKLQINQQESQISHEIGHAAQANQIDATPKSVN